MFLKASDRESLLFQFAKFEKKRRQQQQHPALVLPSYESDDDDEDDPQHQRDGCRVCKTDNDHTNMLLCETCNAEYHFYCIGLRAVPTEDWFCSKYIRTTIYTCIHVRSIGNILSLTPCFELFLNCYDYYYSFRQMPSGSAQQP
jgi:hypothetical protein